MSSETESPVNVPPVNDEDKTTWPIAGARVSPDDLRLIDLARIHGGYANRSELIAEAIMDRARAILKNWPDRLRGAE